MNFKILDKDHSLIDATVDEWNAFIESGQKTLAQNTIDDFWISTVLLGMDHGFGGSPLWFETMIFDEQNRQEYGAGKQKWLSIGAEAMAGHQVAVVATWIIKGVKGEFYPCKPDIFEMTYEPLPKSEDAK